MSDFAKILIPFINTNINKIDLTSSSGFIDMYTKDIDSPYNYNEIYLMYDNTIINEYSIDRAKRFSAMPELKRTYIKYINNKPYIIYAFWVKPDMKKKYDGIAYLNTEEKARILQFWGYYDSISSTILNNNVLVYDTTYTIPPKDYNGNTYDGFIITDKG